MTQAALIAAIRMPGRPTARVRSCLHFTPFSLEIELQGKLHQARITRLRELAELRTITAVSIRIQELRVIEYVEEFGAKLHAFVFVDRNELEDRKVRIADVRTAAHGALGVRNRP